MNKADEQAGYIAVEDNDEDADWIKLRQWDLPTELVGLLQAIAPGADQRAQKDALSHLMTLPAWQAAPDALQQSVVSFLAGQQAIG